MADEIDRAQARDEELRADALAKWRGSRADSAGAARSTCIHCGEPIPAARRLAVPGVRFCVECQTDLEGSANG